MEYNRRKEILALVNSKSITDIRGKTKKKKLFINLFILMLCVVASLFTTKNLKAETIVEEATSEGKQLVLDMYPQLGLELEIRDSVPIYNSSNQPVGVSLSIYWRGTPYGYIVYNSKYHQVTDFSIEPFVTGLDKKNDINKGEKLWTNGLDYSNNKKFNEIDQHTLRSRVEWDSLVTDDTITSDTIYPMKQLKNKYSFAANLIESITKKYACGVVAVLNIAYQNNLINGSEKSIRDSFNRVWKLQKTSVYDRKNGLQYGATSNRHITNSLLSFCKEKGKKKTVVKEYDDATFDIFKKGIDRKCSEIFTAVIRHGGEGHAMSVVGYYKCNRKGDSRYVCNYLMVADGWDKGFRYIDISHTPICNITAILANIK